MIDIRGPGKKNRRRWTRYVATTKKVELVVDGERYSATVIDESVGGVGLLVKQPILPEVSGEAQVYFGDTCEVGYIRSVDRKDDLAIRIAVSWTATDDPYSQYVRRYVMHNSLKILCRLVGSIGLNRYEIKLWNGSRFKVNSERICAANRKQREITLRGMSDVDVRLLARLYGVAVACSYEQTLKNILEFEFRCDDCAPPVTSLAGEA